MGIPAYYSYLIKNFKKIIIKKERLNKTVHNFYLDSNSIIYNCLATLKEVKKEDIFSTLIKEVCLQIDNYIKDVSPRKLVYISFDGVAPVAKLKQQKERRFKSKIITELINDCIKEQTGFYPDSKEDDIFDRTCITPGTEFMDELNIRVSEFFRGREKMYDVDNIIVSGSNERGEGEHKIFDLIRKNKTNETHVIYGLDADLIILCLNHMYITKNIYLFRETPEFVKSISSELDPMALYFMKIDELMDLIIPKMTGKTVNKKNDVDIIRDYVFIMQILGNDFMPHFPSLNIRTHGIEMLLETYKNVLGKKGLYIMDGNIIMWKHLRELISEFSKMELDNLKREYKIREKIQARVIRDEVKTNDNDVSKEAMEKDILNLPIKERDIEKLINPFSYYWEDRYYKYLFNSERNEENLKKICLNYMEGLEWNMEYYSRGCKNWMWKYNYNYPPLFKDLLKFLPIWDIEYVEKNDESISSDVQLAYVLPPSSLYLLPNKYRVKIIKYKHNHNDVEVNWSFCRYFWESHFHFPMENIEEIKEIIEN